MIRVGVIDFTNSCPIFYALKNQIVPHQAHITCGTPVEIDTKLRTGQVDVALVSSTEYSKNRSSYIILSDFGVGAREHVISVRLFFQGQSPLLDMQTVYVPSHSATSARLLKALCKYFWKVSPQFRIYSGDPKHLFEQSYPFLIIGDKCLQYMNSPTHSSIDLGQAWHEATSKGFIYSLIATRKEAFERHFSPVASFHQALHDSYEWAAKNMDVIIDHAAEITHTDRSLIRTYYSTLEHRLKKYHFDGFEYFASLEV